MTNFSYDPEATIQDADIYISRENRNFEKQRLAERLGICFHNHWLGRSDDGTIYYPEQSHLNDNEVICTDTCGAVFDSEEVLELNRQLVYTRWVGSH